MKLSDLYAIEGIDQQLHSSFGFDLEREILRLREFTAVTDNIIGTSQLPVIIKNHTGLTALLTTEPGDNSWVSPLDLHSANVMRSDKHITHLTNADAQALLKDIHFIEGTVNLTTGKISGDFEKLTCHITIGNSYFQKESLLEVTEVAAILLHEIGHLMVYLEMLNRCTRTNYILAEGTKRLLTANTKEQRLVLLNNIEDLIGTNIPNKDTISLKERTEAAYHVIILDASIQQAQQQLDCNIYDARSYEQLADNYVTRLGYGRSLTMGLNKIYQRYGNTAYAHSSFNIFINLFTTLITLPFALGHILGTVLCTNNPLAVSYDPPKKRILKIQQQLSNALKDRSLSKSQKQTFVNDYHAINAVLTTMYHNMDKYEFIHTFFSFAGKRQAATIRQHEELEALLNNPLFTAAAELELLHK